MLGMHKSILDTMHQRFSTSELDLNLCLTEAEIIESEIPKADLVQKNPGNSSKNGATAHQETTPAFNFNHSAGTFKKEPGLNLSSNSPGPSKANPGSLVKKVKKEFSTPPQKSKTNFGTPPKIPNADFGAPSNIDGQLTQTADGGVSCNVCGKVVSCMSSARRHYKTTHEVIIYFVEQIYIRCPSPKYENGF